VTDSITESVTGTFYTVNEIKDIAVWETGGSCGTLEWQVRSVRQKKQLLLEFLAKWTKRHCQWRQTVPHSGDGSWESMITDRLKWTVQCFTSPPTQYRLYGRVDWWDDMTGAVSRQWATWQHRTV